jgi:hypothetical protein
MSFLINRRYGRLLLKPVLYNFLLAPTKKHVFRWDESSGCTFLRPYCNYIHFIRPKGPALDDAMKIAKRGTFAVNYS